MIFGSILIVAGLVLMCMGGLRLVGWQGGSGDDSCGESDWYDSTARQSSSDPKYPMLHFFATILGPLLFGAMLVVFGLLEWKWD
ncbi:MAG: hypothetical protein ABFD92_00770 [Planctomycetaceae bacterium]|nr:hypothetical protein [Planctomycetaceae bacterium]